MDTGNTEVYFEVGWSVLSSIGLVNILIGFMVIAIVNLSRLSIVPIITSVACALANGLCFYAFYTNYAKENRTVAAVFADIFWLIQEAGLSFYSYQLLRGLLDGRQRITYLTIFWILMVAILGMRTSISVFRVLELARDANSLQEHIARLHIGYFIAIAIVETWSAYYLLRVLAEAHKTSRIYFDRHGVWRYLIRSTEIRLATLALIGIMRACTYSFQTEAQKVNNTPSQVDRFAYVLECMFPSVMMIDLVASKLPGHQNGQLIERVDGNDEELNKLQERRKSIASVGLVEHRESTAP